jgi:hypothetical protein
MAHSPMGHGGISRERFLDGTAEVCSRAATIITALKKTIIRMVREPLLHFLLFGAALFALSHYLEERSKFLRVTLTKEQIRRLADTYRLTYGGSPSEQQLSALVKAYVKDEIYYREALKLGLDRDDEIIRRRLVQKYEFLQQDLAMPSEPTDTQLRDFHHQHVNQYQVPGSVNQPGRQATFEEVYEDVRRDYLRAERNRRDAEALANLSAHFTITRE